MRRQTKYTISEVYSFNLALQSVTFDGGGGGGGRPPQGARLMNYVEDHC
jgi:hypothetical protein